MDNKRRCDSRDNQWDPVAAEHLAGYHPLNMDVAVPAFGKLRLIEG
jgi:hypothetical protein